MLEDFCTFFSMKLSPDENENFFGRTIARKRRNSLVKILFLLG